LYQNMHSRVSNLSPAMHAASSPNLSAYYRFPNKSSVRIEDPSMALGDGSCDESPACRNRVTPSPQLVLSSRSPSPVSNSSLASPESLPESMLLEDAAGRTIYGSFSPSDLPKSAWSRNMTGSMLREPAIYGEHYNPQLTFGN